jgi:LysR family transcriptional regulator, regulator for bpeEF and oprC
MPVQPKINHWLIQGGLVDKLRAIQYFLKVIEAGSFTAAARRLEVSPPAVTKLVAALERELGATLLRRNSHHIALTPDGESYLKTCARIMTDLKMAEQSIGVTRTKPSGKLIVGMSRVLGPNCVMPFIPEFMASNPDIELDIRLVHYPHESLASMCDMLVLIGWHHDSDWIAKPIASTRFITVASPAYWKNYRMPTDPAELVSHHCLIHRVPNGVVLDLWRYTRGGESRSVALRPGLIADDRDALVEAAVAGAGIIRVGDLTIQPWLVEGSLQQALSDWTALESPAIYLLHRRGGKQLARVRAFGDFVTDIFQRITERQGHTSQSHSNPKPDWFRTGYVGGLAARASSKIMLNNSKPENGT